MNSALSNGTYLATSLCMPEAEVHAALCMPKDFDGRQVFYDARRNVWAVTVSYLGGQGNSPTPEQIFGGLVEVKPDGSVYKMVKYERAGYYVAYSRDAGDAPFVTIVMQKFPTCRANRMGLDLGLLERVNVLAR